MLERLPGVPGPKKRPALIAASAVALLAVAFLAGQASTNATAASQAAPDNTLCHQATGRHHQPENPERDHHRTNPARQRRRRSAAPPPARLWPPGTRTRGRGAATTPAAARRQAKTSPDNPA